MSNFQPFPKPVISIERFPPDGSLCDSDLEEGLRVGSLTVNSVPDEGAAVTILDETYEFMRVGATTQAWATLTEYAAGELVTESAKFYTAASAHTAGATFAADLAAGKWVEIAEPVIVRRGVGPDVAVAATGAVCVTNGLCDGSTLTLGGCTFELDINHCAEGYVAFRCAYDEYWTCEGTIALPNGHTYSFCFLDPHILVPEDPSIWVSMFGPRTTAYVAQDFVSCVNANDGACYSAYDFGTDEDLYYRTCLTATVPGTSGNGGISTGMSVSVYGMTGGGVLYSGPNIGIEVCDCNYTIAATLADAINAQTAICADSCEDRIDLIAEVAGAAGNCGIPITDCGFYVVGAGMTGGENAFCADAPCVIAAALAVKISCHSAPDIEAAINPACSNEVLIIETS